MNFLYLCRVFVNENMKNWTFFMALAAALMMVLAACDNKKKGDDIITQRIVKKTSKEPIRMQAYHDDRDVEWIGKNYHISVSREPADSLPIVKDEIGQRFVDNVFKMTVSRHDGSVFFSRQFTKTNFVQYIPDNYRKMGILEGIVFDKAEGDWLMFAASVGLPQTDEYIPLIVKLSRMGDLVIVQDTQMDTNGAEGDAGQSDEDDEDGV